MNIDELFVANQKEGNEYLTTCFDEQTTCRFAPKVQAFAFVKMALFLLPNVADCSNYKYKNYYMYICCGKYKVKTVREYMIVYPYLLFYFENEVYSYVMFKKPNT